MKEWKEVKLGDIADIISDKTSIEFATLDNYISTDNMIGNFGGVVKAEKLPTTNKVNVFQKEDTLFSNIRTYFKKVWYSSFKGTVSADVLVFRTKDDEIINSKFLYYLLCNNEFTEYSVLTSKGAKMPRGDKDAIKNYNFNLPPLPEQQAIAEVLSSLDDKIDLLNRQNKTLEQMAETLFRQWFIEEAKEEGKLGDVIEIYDNKRVPLSKMQRNKMKEGKLYPYYGAASIMDYVNDWIFDGEYILLGEDGTVRTNDGYPVLQYATGKFWVNNHTHILQAKQPYNNFFIWNYLSKKNIDRIVTGAVQPKINQTNLKSLDFPLYPLKLVKQFIEQTNPIFEKILNNANQIHTLEKMRDTLLPKLMSGEARVGSDNLKDITYE